MDEETIHLSEIMTDAPFMMEHTTAYKALEKFKKTGIHYAFVADEYGAFQGIITLNDILEALVGDASDFYKDGYYLYTTATFDLKEGNFYTLSILNDTDVVYKDKIFCTNQVIANFSINDGQYVANQTTNDFIVYE